MSCVQDDIEHAQQAVQDTLHALEKNRGHAHDEVTKLISATTKLLTSSKELLKRHDLVLENNATLAEWNEHFVDENEELKRRLEERRGRSRRWRQTSYSVQHLRCHCYRTWSAAVVQQRFNNGIPWCLEHKSE